MFRLALEMPSDPPDEVLEIVAIGADVAEQFDEDAAPKQP
jgi:hypothetical protein